MCVLTASNFLRELADELADPEGFFMSKQDENWKNPLFFFFSVTLVLSFVTPIMNSLGFESNDLSSAYQAQIIAFDIVHPDLIEAYGAYAYIVEAALIMTLSMLIVAFLTVLLHVVYRLIGGHGPILNAWKAACYGAGPCLLGGFLPYVSVFVGFYSFAMQFYLGPMNLYQARQSRAIAVFVAFIAATFIEMFVRGTTANSF
jgi:hypothetical protein